MLSATTSTSALMFAKDALATTQTPDDDENVNVGEDTPLCVGSSIVEGEECSGFIARETADNSGERSTSNSEEASAVNDSEQHPRLDDKEQSASLNVENIEDEKKTQDVNKIKTQTKYNQETNQVTNQVTYIVTNQVKNQVTAQIRNQSNQANKANKGN